MLPVECSVHLGEAEDAAVAVPLTLVVISMACRNICIISRAGKNVDFHLRIEYAMHIQLVEVLHCGT